MTIRRFPQKAPVYLSCGHVDMRKSINGLAAVVQGAFELDPFQGALFVFCNKDRNKIKVLFWDKDGFALYYKRRERGRSAGHPLTVIKGQRMRRSGILEGCSMAFSWRSISREKPTRSSDQNV